MQNGGFSQCGSVRIAVPDLSRVIGANKKARNHSRPHHHTTNQAHYALFARYAVCSCLRY